MKCLIIDKPWINLILDGEKTWEMRSRATKIRGIIGLIEKGSGHVVGVAVLENSLPPLTLSTMEENFQYHKIPVDFHLKPGYKWFTPWELSYPVRFTKPVPYVHPQGAVTWVNLNVKDVVNGFKQKGS